MLAIIGNIMAHTVWSALRGPDITNQKTNDLIYDKSIYDNKNKRRVPTITSEPKAHDLEHTHKECGEVKDVCER